MSLDHSRQTSYRILDASANRAAEGIRTIEEFVRFGLDDSQAAAVAKELRHELATALSRLNRAELLAARDTEGDVGTALETTAEYSRAEIADVITAAAERVQQSLRVLEEYGKTVDVEFARQIESLRYRAYTHHRQIELDAITGSRKRRLAEAVLYLLIDCGRSESEFIERLQTLSHAGVDVFQLRDKQAHDRQLFERAKCGASIAKDCNALFIVNDRADIALAAGADGVHVGQDELPAAMARRVLGSERLVGVSTHTIDQVHQTIRDGADYIGCGPTFPSSTKSFGSHAGTAFLDQVHAETRQTPRPAFAIGGINRTNLDQVTACGFHRIAVTAAINDAEDPAAAARELRRRLVDR
ncbi:Thiamine-phosphate synthase [Stieleria maiorica]|uniref:Thiamine-phosphate synthase n=1 Tax=Stieleria maiorica TaxID=2795974 RepID=A0A5B9M4G8_9BACT|nr:Thiamine-phosphate synthase [Stieleria maiorica]